MKKEIFKTEFATYFIHEENQILEQFWTNKNQNMTSEQYKEDMLNFLKLTKENEISSTIVNLKTFFFTIVPEVQEWVDQNITFYTKDFLKKAAFVVPEDFIERLSLEQTLSEKNAEAVASLPIFGISYFEKEEEAFEWLKN